jgi:hypothetical protein
MLVQLVEKVCGLIGVQPDEVVTVEASSAESLAASIIPLGVRTFSKTLHVSACGVPVWHYRSVAAPATFCVTQLVGYHPSHRSVAAVQQPQVLTRGMCPPRCRWRCASS